MRSHCIKSFNIREYKLLDSFDLLNDYLVENKYFLNSHLIFHSDNNFSAFQKFKDIFHFIVAAGGLVKNEKNNFLMIYKNNKWDLPKGKVDVYELHATAALREVCEETGVVDLKIISSLFSTFHIYHCPYSSERVILKETKWFLMQSHSCVHLMPQKEEGIVDVSWLDYKKIQSIDTYDSIRHLFSDFMRKKDQLN